MVSLTGPRRAAQSGKADALVIFVHGYGADGNDLIGLADPLAPHLPNVTFFAPNAPDRCTNNPMGYQWFPIPRMDGSTEVQMGVGFARAQDLFNTWLDETLAAEGIAADRVVLVGFSQGTMMSLQIAPRRAEQLAGVVGFSGRLMFPERLKEEIVTKPPMLLVHGDMDDVVPTSSLPDAANGLSHAGIVVKTHISRGTGHGIAPDGLTLALQHIQSWLA